VTQPEMTTEKPAQKTDAEILAELEKDAQDIIPNVEMPAPLPKTKKPEVEKETKPRAKSPEFATKMKLKDIHLSTMWNRDKLGDITGLVQSIKAEGQIVPIAVRVRDDGRFELVDGRRRYAALTEAGMTEALVVFSDCEDPTAGFRKSMAANLARADNTPLELARSFALLREAGDKIKDIAFSIGWKDSRVSQYLKLEVLPDEAKKMLAQEKLDFSAARALCTLTYDDPRDLRYFDKIMGKLKEGKLNAMTVEAAVIQYLERKNIADKDKPSSSKTKKKGGKKSKSEVVLYDYTDKSYVKSMKPLKPASVGALLNRIQEKRNVARSPKQRAYLDGFQEGLLNAVGMGEEN
jgi:ParB/RepB/Spo0J family partition protein